MGKLKTRVLDVESLLSQFNREFPSSVKNVKILIDFATGLGVQVDLGFDAVDKVIKNFDKLIAENVEKTKIAQLQLDESKREGGELTLKKLLLESFIGEMREAGVLENFEKDPF